ncbi:uncharacterized protein LOC122797090 [Protopterus annectens]|uniref:uncharacterized protein LOC122797090 n=1 Tax=Protopterus annectens TaxID=7888 RepID=UPI001CFC23DF|nr:uncharacterized protein LOC122797090 [Protopterus annectens]
MGEPYGLLDSRIIPAAFSSPKCFLKFSRSPGATLLERSLKDLSSFTLIQCSALFCVDSRAVRRKILHQLAAIQYREQKFPESWHFQARILRPRTDTVYMIYDINDIQLGQSLKNELKHKGLQVLTWEKLGQSKEEFLKTNSPLIASAAKVLLILTETAAGSTFVYHQILFSEWLGKTILIAVFRNPWPLLRTALRAMLGEKPAVDFENQLYPVALNILDHQLNPPRRVPGVILAQSYLERMEEGVKPLKALTVTTVASFIWPQNSDEVEPKVFISYQWDSQAKILEISRYLEANGLPCWTDLCVRGQSRIRTRTEASSDRTGDTLHNSIQRSMKAAFAVLSCITPKYIQSDNCHKDLQLAATLQKPLVPVLLRFMPWPPDGIPKHIRRFLFNHPVIDLSTERLFQQNLSIVLSRIKQCIKN